VEVAVSVSGCSGQAWSCVPVPFVVPAIVGTVGPSGAPELPQPYVYLGVRLTADPNGYVDPMLLLPRTEAADLVRRMAGRFRLPDALRRVDALARGRAAADPARAALPGGTDPGRVGAVAVVVPRTFDHERPQEV